MKLKAGYLRKINKIDKPSSSLYKKKNGLKSTKLEMKRRSFCGHNRIQRLVRDYCKQLYVNERANLEEMDKLLERYNLLRLMQEEIENMKRLKSPSTETETVIKILKHTKYTTRWLYWQILSNI